MRGLKVGSSVKVDQGFGKFWMGKVVSFDDKNRNAMGHYGNYEIEVVSGINMFGKPMPVGAIFTVLHRHVSIN